MPEPPPQFMLVSLASPSSDIEASVMDTSIMPGIPQCSLSLIIEGW
ncbi:hypothetical protein QPB21_005083 [Vibrio alginolyticus]|nr:hypothetical protein [Vibrio alginolyticus]EJE3286462.1 hypothetical protein [Vibrio alginolyticus]EJE3289799.1 hypothetical protein [Vibrio alginolyticus]EJN3359640.1 hypothetical protein [Vibrio alginolyticus]EJS0369310.1 hypothetical protein [Vibrio alginolyticus]